MKFDSIISNPPYTNSIDIKILESVQYLSDNIVFVHPITWLIEKKNIYKKVRDLVSTRLVSVDIFNGNPLFNIAIYVECAITVFKEKNNGIIRVDLDTYRDIHKISKYGNTEIYYSIEEKVFSISNNVWDNRIKGADETETKDWWVSLSGGRAHVEQINHNEPVFRKSDYYTICNRNLQPTRKRSTHHNWKFSTDQEALNFIKFLNTKIVRFFISIIKNNMHIDNGELRMVPWLDFKTIWDDKKIANYMGITEKELEWILRQIPNYYEEDFLLYK